jgi:MoaA/NifB/PqqE/SkfB family radical SAM enzyme
MTFNSEQKISPQFRGTPEENLSIEVTTECNGLCGHCFVRANVKEHRSLSLETAGNIITEGYDLGYRHLHITGGEPLLWKPLSNLFDLAFERGFQSVFCNTNGTMLTEEKCRMLTSYGNKLIISVSLHGDERVHDCMCGSGSYGRTTQGLRNAIEGGIKTVVFSTIGKSLLGELPGFVVRIFGEYSIELLTLIHMIRVKDDIFDLSSELLSPRDFIRLVNTVSLLNLYGLSVEILENPLANVVAAISAINWLPKARSQHRKGRIVVLANGRIVPSHPSSDSLGTYRPGILEEILMSERYRDAVSSNDTICTRCEHHATCISHGMNRSSEWYRDMDDEIPYCKRVLDCLKASEFGDRCCS